MPDARAAIVLIDWRLVVNHSAVAGGRWDLLLAAGATRRRSRDGAQGVAASAAPSWLMALNAIGTQPLSQR